MKFLLPILLLFVLCGCNNGDQERKNVYGKIEYQINFLDKSQEQFFITNRLMLYFQGNNTSVVLEGFMNMFEFKYITLPKENKNYSVLRIVDKTYVYEQKCGTLAYGYEKMGKVSITETDDTKMICGYKCKKALIEANGKKFSVFYTTEIDVENPNINNPYKEIEGVLLEFEVNMNNMNMKFTAIKVDNQKPDKSKFELPKNFRKVEKQQIDSIFKIYREAINS